MLSIIKGIVQCLCERSLYEDESRLYKIILVLSTRYTSHCRYFYLSYFLSYMFLKEKLNCNRENAAFAVQESPFILWVMMTCQFPFVSIDWDYIPRNLAFNLRTVTTSLHLLKENKKQLKQIWSHVSRTSSPGGQLSIFRISSGITWYKGPTSANVHGQIIICSEMTQSDAVRRRR